MSVGMKPKPYFDLICAIKGERQFNLKVVMAIAEVEKRSIHLSEGYSSLFQFLTQRFGYSDSAAVRRIAVARCIRNVPEMRVALEDRKLEITSASLVASLKEPNQIKEILAQVEGKSYREIEELVRAKRPESVSEQRDRVKRISVWKVAEQGEFPSKTFCNQQLEVENKLRVEFTASKELESKIQKAKELLSGKYPKGASLEQVFEVALDELIAKKEKKTTREPRGSDNPRYISPKLREEVMERDNHCCSFRGVGGKKCDSRWDLEVDHVLPFSQGGETTAENLRVLCRAHNLFEAKEKLGAEFVESCLERLE